MTTKKESHAKRQAPPLPVGARNLNKPKYAKRTQFQHTNLSRRPRFRRNEPNFTPDGPAEDQNMRSEPNCPRQLCETNPKNNAGRRPATPIFNPHGSGGPAIPTPKMRNEPKKNRPPQAGLHLYNPPVSPAGYPSLPIHRQQPQKMRNEPNFLPGQQPKANSQKLFSRNEPNLRPASLNTKD